LSSTAESHPRISLLRRELGFRDVLLFNIATVLGPRWIAAAAHNGPSSVSLWLLAAAFFFLPTALVIVELSTRYPTEGGLYVWTKEAFGDFHGFVAGWCYWIYTFFYFPGLLLASVAMSSFIGGPSFEWLNHDRRYLVGASLALLAVAVALNIVGLQIGKWLQNAGGVGTYVPLLILAGAGLGVWWKQGSATAVTAAASLPSWDWDTVNFWSQIAFAFVGLELICTMAEEVRDPGRTFPRAILASGVLIVVIYIVGTLAVLAILPPEEVDPRSGVFQAVARGSALLGVPWLGVLAALLVTAGNAGGVGTTVAGVARVPMVVGIDRYLPEAFGHIHPRWRTPWIAMLVQAGLSAVVLVASQVNETVLSAYQILVDAAVILYFIPFLYMYAAATRLAFREQRTRDKEAVLIPGGRLGVVVVSAVAFAATALSILVSVVPPKGTENVLQFELKLVGGTVLSIGIGLVLYGRGVRAKRREGQP
jgi:glutamate:GABA antiporter